MYALIPFGTEPRQFRNDGHRFTLWTVSISKFIASWNKSRQKYELGGEVSDN